MGSIAQAPHVLILGGGLGGLTLAQSLRKQGISFEIFERDQKGARPEGWAIGLHTMLKDLVASSPDDMPPFYASVNHLNPLTTISAEISYHRSTGGEKWGVRDDGEGNKFMRCNRTKLRDWLVTGLSVQHNKKAISIEDPVDNSDGPLTVHFQDGTSAKGDVVVGADGTHSIARRHLLRGRPDPIKTVPATVISCDFPLSGDPMISQLRIGASATIITFPDPDFHTEEKPKMQNMFVGLNNIEPDGLEGNFYLHLVDDNSGIPLMEGNSDPSAWSRVATGEQLLDRLLSKTRDITNPRLRVPLDAATAEGMKVPPIIMHTLIMKPGFLENGRCTLLGDAAHAMPPFRGEGGAMAMIDALNLGRAIGSATTLPNGESLAARLVAALGKYQDEMLSRGSSSAEGSSKELDKPVETKGRTVVGWPLTMLDEQEVVLGPGGMGE